MEAAGEQGGCTPDGILREFASMVGGLLQLLEERRWGSCMAGMRGSLAAVRERDGLL